MQLLPRHDHGDYTASEIAEQLVDKYEVRACLSPVLPQFRSHTDACFRRTHRGMRSARSTSSAALSRSSASPMFCTTSGSPEEAPVEH